MQLQTQEGEGGEDANSGVGVLPSFWVTNRGRGKARRGESMQQHTQEGEDAQIVCVWVGGVPRFWVTTRGGGGAAGGNNNTREAGSPRDA